MTGLGGHASPDHALNLSNLSPPCAGKQGLAERGRAVAMRAGGIQSSVKVSLARYPVAQSRGAGKAARLGAPSAGRRAFVHDAKEPKPRLAQRPHVGQRFFKPRFHSSPWTLRQAQDRLDPGSIDAGRYGGRTEPLLSLSRVGE